MRTVAIVHPSMHFIGGAERLITDLAVGLADNETRVQLVTGLCHDVWRTELCRNKFVSLAELGRIAPGSLSFWLSVPRIAHAFSSLIEADVDVILTSSFPASIIGEKYGVKHHAMIVHYLHEAPMVLHDAVGVNALPLGLRTFYRTMSAVYAKADIEAVRGSDKIIANSRLTRRANSEVYGISESDMQVIYPGVSAQCVSSHTRVPKMISSYVKEGIPILFIPRGVQAWRNPETCLGALRELNFPFLAVFTGGTDHKGDQLLRRAKVFGIADRILWRRELPNENIAGLYLRSLVVISIPKRQPFGLIPLEALIHGAAPIISRSSGVSEVLRDRVDVICVDESDPMELSNAIKTLVSDDALRKKIVTNGNRTVVERLSSARFVNEMRAKLFE